MDHYQGARRANVRHVLHNDLGYFIYVVESSENRDPVIVNMKYEPTFAVLTSDPRFIALTKAAGIL